MSSLIIIAWIDTNTWSKVDNLGSQFSVALPLHVPNSDRHTFPQAYKLGLNLTFPLPVVVKLTLGGPLG